MHITIPSRDGVNLRGKMFSVTTLAIAVHLIAAVAVVGQSSSASDNARQT